MRVIQTHRYSSCYISYQPRYSRAEQVMNASWIVNSLISLYYLISLSPYFTIPVYPYLTIPLYPNLTIPVSPFFPISLSFYPIVSLSCYLHILHHHVSLSPYLTMTHYFPISLSYFFPISLNHYLPISLSSYLTICIDVWHRYNSVVVPILTLYSLRIPYVKNNYVQYILCYSVVYNYLCYVCYVYY